MNCDNNNNDNNNDNIMTRRVDSPLLDLNRIERLYNIFNVNTIENINTNTNTDDDLIFQYDDDNDEDNDNVDRNDLNNNIIKDDDNMQKILHNSLASSLASSLSLSSSFILQGE